LPSAKTLTKYFQQKIIYYSHLTSHISLFTILNKNLRN
jgi:hypothetical protein